MCHEFELTGETIPNQGIYSFKQGHVRGTGLVLKAIVTTVSGRLLESSAKTRFALAASSSRL